MLIETLDIQFVSSCDLEKQCADYLELTDEFRAKVIKKASDANTCLVEAHSHIGQGIAAFSHTDIMGLRETVPHMQWRLPSRPYVALVFAGETFDALAWQANAKIPVPLSRLRVGRRSIRPTNISIKRWLT
jgi:hypothetical protein